MTFIVLGYLSRPLLPSVGKMETLSAAKNFTNEDVLDLSVDELKKELELHGISCVHSYNSALSGLNSSTQQPLSSAPHTATRLMTDFSLRDHSTTRLLQRIGISYAIVSPSTHIALCACIICTLEIISLYTRTLFKAPC